MTVTVNGTEFDSHHVDCPECGGEVDAQVVMLERGCPACGVGYRVFFDEVPDPRSRRRVGGGVSNNSSDISAGWKAVYGAMEVDHE